MKLLIADHEITPKPDQSLLEIIEELGLLRGKLSTDPLAARIAGRTFTLHYVPRRQKDITPERESVRKAVAASGGRIGLLYYTDHEGQDIYTRTVQFVLFLAIRRLWPAAIAKMSCTLGTGMYIRVTGAEDFDPARLRAEVEGIVAERLPLRRRRIPTAEAIVYYTRQGQLDKARLFSYRQKPTLDVYENGDFMEYYHGEMAPDTGYLRSYDLLPAPEGFIFVYPDRADPDRVSVFREQPNLFRVYTEGKRWGELMRCETVADLNELTDTEGQQGLRELIRVNEALHEKSFSGIADSICRQGARVVMLAGPSSSGKTTSANRLATQLRVHGRLPAVMSLDDYYRDRDQLPVASDGRIDLEHINALDTELFCHHLKALLQGEEVTLPKFSFKDGKRMTEGRPMRLSEESVLLVEGLHGLNPALLPQGVEPQQIFRVYVSPLLPLNLDLHSRIPCSYLRLLRRIVRDHETRNTSVRQTLAMWDSVRAGEEKWIYPFQENADVIFNSSTLYELSVLKRHIFPLLDAVEPGESCYSHVRAMVKILNFIHEADVDDEIPPTSVVREFIGGNSFYRR